MPRPLVSPFGILVVASLSLSALRAATAAEPVDPELIPEARRVLEYLESVQGQKILSGISGSQDAQPRAVLHMTGREPALAGGDMAGFHRKWDATYRQVMQHTVDRSIRWWRQKGGIVALQYHWMKHGDAPEAAIDGDPNSMWWSDNDQPDPQWLMVDLGAERTVGAVSVLWWKAYAKDYTSEVSTDGTSWREVARIEKRSNWLGDMDVLRFEPAGARYVRLHCTGRAVTWQAYTVYELGVYESVPQ